MCHYPEQPAPQVFAPGPGSGPRYNYGPQSQGGPPSDNSTETSETTLVDNFSNNGRGVPGSTNAPRNLRPGYQPPTQSSMTHNNMGFN
ncbi:hypothetical protein PHYBLDRAFT_142510 [Phycomyces blakesleeanus NRRL 1555(-)]|uniref:Uncharacterized protein n=1 Tax=Phycomyces blakesleeanus (strain ATCC 8743b / DSM 1359 / FGSC 10004 / NBRC 33097 / NRRL 1555) TaxID=763407 RepID=A0A162PXW0_PHYB8|nr:hypothetical protein PHYBLDRAFT_142510 [Phycomyces blakesleeanus NRRL 1555(-)]OAD76997.1 hypothetical protein PHYBLDRAFT_142510 [Phycomyces blakesleeanus NRRL 1555(-)]|eukprot:XP_018295037.1 hypothetical protein PHYBLDRAFT_142510 [Phycomyces blakesleeanus NRRL 1555(-)]